MKNILLILLTVVLSLSRTSVKYSDVYLFDSNSVKKYHYTKNCRGLSNCKHEIIKVPLKKAQTLGKTLFSWSIDHWFFYSDEQKYNGYQEKPMVIMK